MNVKAAAWGMQTRAVYGSRVLSYINKAQFAFALLDSTDVVTVQADLETQLLGPAEFIFVPEDG